MSTEKDGKLAAIITIIIYNLPFSHIMILVIISNEDMLVVQVLLRKINRIRYVLQKAVDF